MFKVISANTDVRYINSYSELIRNFGDSGRMSVFSRMWYAFMMDSSVLTTNCEVIFNPKRIVYVSSARMNQLRTDGKFTYNDFMVKKEEILSGDTVYMYHPKMDKKEDLKSKSLWTRSYIGMWSFKSSWMPMRQEDDIAVQRVKIFENSMYFNTSGILAVPEAVFETMVLYYGMYHFMYMHACDDMALAQEIDRKVVSLECPYNVSEDVYNDAIRGPPCSKNYKKCIWFYEAFANFNNFDPFVLDNEKIFDDTYEGECVSDDIHANYVRLAKYVTNIVVSESDDIISKIPDDYDFNDIDSEEDPMLDVEDASMDGPYQYRRIYDFSEDSVLVRKAYVDDYYSDCKKLWPVMSPIIRRGDSCLAYPYEDKRMLWAEFFDHTVKNKGSVLDSSGFFLKCPSGGRLDLFYPSNSGAESMINYNETYSVVPHRLMCYGGDLYLYEDYYKYSNCSLKDKETFCMPVFDCGFGVSYEEMKAMVIVVSTIDRAKWSIVIMDYYMKVFCDFNFDTYESFKIFLDLRGAYADKKGYKVVVYYYNCDNVELPYSHIVLGDAYIKSYINAFVTNHSGDEWSNYDFFKDNEKFETWDYDVFIVNRTSVVVALCLDIVFSLRHLICDRGMIGVYDNSLLISLSSRVSFVSYVKEGNKYVSSNRFYSAYEWDLYSDINVRQYLVVNGFDRVVYHSVTMNMCSGFCLDEKCNVVFFAFYFYERVFKKIWSVFLGRIEGINDWKEKLIRFLSAKYGLV
jgi:hypothetical protein